MGTMTSDNVVEAAKSIGAGLEAANARRAIKTETRLKGELDAARVATDAAIHALKVKVEGQLSGTEIAVLMGFDDRQTVHMRDKRHQDRDKSSRPA